MSSSLVELWGRGAVSGKPRRATTGREARTWLRWTQYADHGPDGTVLGPVAGRAVLDLGSGRGDDLAHLVTLGATGVGVDVAPTREEVARERWGHLPGVEFRAAEATAFLVDGGDVRSGAVDLRCRVVHGPGHPAAARAGTDDSRGSSGVLPPAAGKPGATPWRRGYAARPLPRRVGTIPSWSRLLRGGRVTGRPASGQGRGHDARACQGGLTGWACAPPLARPPDVPECCP